MHKNLNVEEEDAGSPDIHEMARKLWLAVEVGDKVGTVKILQNQMNNNNLRSSINCCNNDGWTPIHVAANEGHTNLIEILVDYGAMIDPRTKTFRTPLHIACMRGNFGVI